MLWSVTGTWEAWVGIVYTTPKEGILETDVFRKWDVLYWIKTPEKGHVRKDLESYRLPMLG